jgi:hypothetical protein
LAGEGKFFSKNILKIFFNSGKKLESKSVLKVLFSSPSRHNSLDLAQKRFKRGSES